MLRAVKEAIKRHDLIESGSHLLMAVSGGADSVALLHVFSRLAESFNFRLTVCHVNHGLRGADSDRDAAFVEQLAGDLGMPVVVGRRDVGSAAKAAGVSIEMAARDARLGFFREQLESLDAVAVVTAHHADDQAETVLLRLLRGTGIDGLGGMRVRSEVDGVTLLRPLLQVTREQVLNYLDSQGLSWCEDDSNRDTDMLRNRVRHDLLPLLDKDYAEGIRSRLASLADVVQADSEWLGILSEDMLRSVTDADGCLAVDGFSDWPLAARRRVVRAWLRVQRVPSTRVGQELTDRVVELAMRRSGTGEVSVGDDRCVQRRHQHLRVVESMEAVPEWSVELAVPGVCVVDAMGFKVEATIAIGIVRDAPEGVGVLPARASISLRTLGNRALQIRSWRAGDRLLPMGMTGSRKLQDVFTDAHIQAEARSGVPVIVCEDEVVYLAGYRVARGWEVQEGEEAIQLRITDQSS